MRKIEMEQVTFSYQENRNVLEDINLVIEEGETVGIIGANGVGKSTLLKLLVGLLPEYQGTIQLNGMSVEKNNYELIREKTGYVFQDSESQLFMSAVYEDVAFGPRNYGYGENEVHERVMDALEQVNMTELKDRQIYHMSGGQKKLASLATVLALQPEIILFDEPSIALDPKNRRKLIQIVNEMSNTMLIASHDLDMILDTCERTVLLDEQRIIADGPTRELLNNKELLCEHDLELPLSLSRGALC